MIFWSSINCPTVICSPTFCYFSREKPLVKPTAPGSSLSYHLPLRSTFYLLLFSDIFIQNPKNNFAAIYCYLFCSRPIYQSTTNLPHVCLPILRRSTPEAIDNPFNMSGCEVLLFVCRCCLRCVAWFSYLFDNLGFFTEGNTYATVLHHPFLFKETNASSRRSKKNFWRRCRGGLRSSQDIPSTHHKLISLALHYFPFASRFPLPHFTLAVLFALSFPFSSLFRLPLLCPFALMALPKNIDIHLKRLERLNQILEALWLYNLSIIIYLETILKSKRILWVSWIKNLMIYLRNFMV